MNKFFFIGILTILSVSASFAQVKIGVTAGLNASDLIENGSGTNHNYKAGFQTGVVADFSISDNFSIIPELLYSQRGAISKLKTTDKDGKKLLTSKSLNLNYLQLPINMAYKINLGNSSKLMIFAGPYLGYGISGKVKSEAKSDKKKNNNSDKIKFGSKEEEVKPLDFGVNAGIGYQFENVFFKLQYNPGLINLNNKKNHSLKNTNVAVSVGYYIL